MHLLAFGINFLPHSVNLILITLPLFSTPPFPLEVGPLNPARVSGGTL